MAKWTKDMPPEERQKRVDHARENLADPVIREKMFGPEAQNKKRATLARKKAFKELAKHMLETNLPEGDELRDVLAAAGFDQFDYQSGVLLGQMNKAIRGDTEAAKFVRDSSGQKPTETMQVGGLDDVPISEMDLSALTTAQLREKMAEVEERLAEEEEE